MLANSTAAATPDRYQWRPETRTVCGWRFSVCEDKQPPPTPGELTSTGICQSCARVAFESMRVSR
jgi:hypothetical protein